MSVEQSVLDRVRARIGDSDWQTFPVDDESCSRTFGAESGAATRQALWKLLKDNEIEYTPDSPTFMAMFDKRRGEGPLPDEIPADFDKLLNPPQVQLEDRGPDLRRLSMAGGVVTVRKRQPS